MSSLFDINNNLSEKKTNKYGFILIAIFFIWLFFPHNNSFIQLSYWANNCIYAVLKTFHLNKMPEYMHYRNNAIYLAKIYPKKPAPSFRELDKAIAAVPADMTKKELSKLYKDSAVIKLYYGDKQGALEYYLQVKNRDASDNFRIAILLSDESRFSEAEKYCNDIIYRSQALSGYVCLSYVYEKTGDVDSAFRIYDSLLDTHPNNVMAYMERAHLKQRIEDEEGYQEDIKKAKELSSYVSEYDTSIIDKAINLKELPLSLI